MNATKILLSGVVLAVAACGVDDRSSVWIQGRAAPSSETECTYAPGGEYQLGNGLLDVAVLDETALKYQNALAYSLPLYIRNDMKKPVGEGQSDTGNDFIVENVRISVNPDGYVSRYHPNPPLLDFSALGGNPARASVGHSGPPVEAEGGESATVVDAIPSDLGFVIQSAVQKADTAAGTTGGLHHIVLGIAIRGRTNDGHEIDLNEYYYPIDVCQGCLPVPPCANPPTKVGCGYPGQDKAPVCAAPATTTP